MAIPKHLEEAAARLKQAAARIDKAREEPPSLKALEQWLSALTDFSLALSDIQSFNNESVHEKLHELADRIGYKRFAPARRPRR